MFDVLQPKFSDLEDYYTEMVINRMNGLALIEGYQDKDNPRVRLAKPDQNITRAEFSVLVYRLMNINPDNPLISELSATQVNNILSRFKDADQIPVWTKQVIAALVDKNYISAKNGKFMANTPIDQVEAAFMLQKVINNLPAYNKENVKEAEMPNWAKIAIGLPDLNGTLHKGEYIYRAVAFDVLYKIFILGMGW